MPRQGFVLSIFRSASAHATPTPWGEKRFGVEFNYAHWALKSKNILNLCSLPQTSALWGLSCSKTAGFEGGLFQPIFNGYIFYLFSGPVI